MRVSELVASIAQHCQQNLESRHVLAISDSSEINLNSHLGRLKSEGLGVVGNNTDVGFYIHPTLIGVRSKIVGNAKQAIAYKMRTKKVNRLPQ